MTAAVITRSHQPFVEGQLSLFGVTETGRNLLAGWRSWARVGQNNALAAAVRLTAGEPLVRHKRNSSFGWTFVCPVPECGVMQSGYETRRECHNAWFDHCREARANRENGLQVLGHPASFEPRWPYERYPLEESVADRMSKVSRHILETGTADTPADAVAWAVGAKMAGHALHFMGPDKATVRVKPSGYEGGSMDRGWYECTSKHFLVQGFDRSDVHLRVPWTAAERLVRREHVTESMRNEMSAAMRYRRDMTGYDEKGRLKAAPKVWWAIEDRCREAGARVWEACMPASVRRMVRAICDA